MYGRIAIVGNVNTLKGFSQMFLEQEVLDLSHYLK